MGAFIADYYELLGLDYNATKEDIKTAYQNKIINAPNEIIAENYKTAYITLIDDNRRYTYDSGIGIHRYGDVSKLKKAAKAAGRIILTLLDVIMTFYWCFFIAVVIAFVFYVVIKTKQFAAEDAFKLLLEFKEEAELLVLFGIADYVLHFYVRRANRKLKAVNWEIKPENNKMEENG